MHSPPPVTHLVTRWRGLPNLARRGTTGRPKRQLLAPNCAVGLRIFDPRQPGVNHLVEEGHSTFPPLAARETRQTLRRQRRASSIQHHPHRQPKRRASQRPSLGYCICGHRSVVPAAAPARFRTRDRPRLRSRRRIARCGTRDKWRRTVSVTRFAGAHYFLSNYFHAPITLKGAYFGPDAIVFPTNEHAFAACKTLDPALPARSSIRWRQVGVSPQVVSLKGSMSSASSRRRPLLIARSNFCEMFSLFRLPCNAVDTASLGASRMRGGTSS